MKDHPQETPQAEMTLGEHLEELRRRILYALLGLGMAMAVSLLFTDHLLAFLRQPFDAAVAEIRQAYPGAPPPVLTTDRPTGGFTMYLRVALFSGLVLSSPWICYQMWLFIAAGLLWKEKRYVTLSVPFSAALFLAGVAFCWWAVAYPAMAFLLHFNAAKAHVVSFIQLDQHILFLLRLMLAFGIAFQTPLAIALLAKVGLVSMDKLRRYRRHVIVGILLLAAVLTPPDIFTQIMLAVPMYLLYELGVVLAWVWVFRKQTAQAGHREPRRETPARN